MFLSFKVIDNVSSLDFCQDSMYSLFTTLAYVKLCLTQRARRGLTEILI